MRCYMRKRNYRIWIEIALMLIVSAVIYLPFINQFGYYNDDWYSMYAARVGGTQTFHEMYSIDRPGRAYVMIPLYKLFQGHPLYYNISAYVFRVLGALCLLWFLRLIWNKRNHETYLIAFLFLIYPGFLSMPNAIDFQSHLIGITLAFMSLALSVLAVHEDRWAQRLFLWTTAALTGWAYLSQMEYYIGFEAVRLLALGMIVWRKNPSWWKTIVGTLRSWLPYSVIPVFYLLWRIFLFDNQRATTDASLQLGALINSPLPTLYAWIENFVQSFLNVLLLAWGVPLYQLSFPLDVSNSIRGMLIAFAVGILSLLVIHGLNRNATEGTETGNWRQEMLVMGFLWIIAGLIMVILANRSVTFPIYSRYGLVSAAGAIMVLVTWISYLSQHRLQLVLVGFLFFSAAFTHYANGLQYARFTQNLRAFWWQVSWRVPQFEEGTTLIASYPGSGIREDSFVWGPANQIYYPYKIKPNTIQAGVYAILLDHDAVVKILTRERQVYRKHIIVDTYRNYRNFVILSQPSPNSCVQIIDGFQPEYSHYENDSILVIGRYSEVEHIKLDGEFKNPPSFLFGPEPPRTWCYYYEKATYERQRGNWAGVISIGEQAFSKGQFPSDPIEWMPFLQAYALNGNAKRLAELAPKVIGDIFIAQQVCGILNSISSLSLDVKTVVDQNYCISN